MAELQTKKNMEIHKKLSTSLRGFSEGAKKVSKSLDNLTLQLGCMNIKGNIEKVFLNNKTKEVGIRWKDGTITTGKCNSEDQFDEYIGFSIVVAAKVFGSKNKMHKFVWENFYPEA